MFIKPFCICSLEGDLVLSCYGLECLAVSKAWRGDQRDIILCSDLLHHTLDLSHHCLYLVRLEHAERVTLDHAAYNEDLAEVVRQMESEDPEEELLEITALVIGITGAGKSASINSLLGYDAVSADAFNGTKKVNDR